jgi:hypothetical protein
MISAKNGINSESLNEFGHGRLILDIFILCCCDGLSEDGIEIILYSLHYSI